MQGHAAPLQLLLGQHTLRTGRKVWPAEAWTSLSLPQSKDGRQASRTITKSASADIVCPEEHREPVGISMEKKENVVKSPSCAREAGGRQGPELSSLRSGQSTVASSSTAKLLLGHSAWHSNLPSQLRVSSETNPH